MIGFAGAHRSGKSTLAKRVAAELGVAFYDGSFGRISKELGWNSVADLSVAERLHMQRSVLERYEREILAQPRPCITDRTPLDMAAYMLAEVGMHGKMDAESSKAVCDYVERCIAITVRHFGLVFMVAILDTFVVEEGKPPENRAYQIHIQMLIEAGLWAAEGPTRAFVGKADLETRVAGAKATIVDEIQELKNDLAQAVHVH